MLEATLQTGQQSVHADVLPAGVVPPDRKQTLLSQSCRSGGPLLKPRAQVLLSSRCPGGTACCRCRSSCAVPAQPRWLAAAGAAALESALTASPLSRTDSSSGR